MNATTLVTIVSLMTATIAASVDRADGQTVANGPYYATPSWDQTLPCTAPTSCPRFIVLANFSNAAVLDRETGLVWRRAPATSMTQFDVNACVRHATGNRLGWRVPTVEELSTLIDVSVALPGPVLLRATPSWE